MKIFATNRIEIEKISINGTYYHGSTFDLESGEFDNLDSDYSDWGAVWLTSDENVAEIFAKDWNDFDDENTFPIVFKIELNVDNIADIDVNRKPEFDEYLSEMGFFDYRELITHLKRMGYNGWETTGSIGHTYYDDVAIFGDVNINVAKILKNGVWSDYVPIENIMDELGSNSFTSP